MAALPIPSVLPVIRNYLSHYGFTKTLMMFEKTTNTGPERQAEVDPSLRYRKTLREMLMRGDVLAAIELTNKVFPDLLTTNFGPKSRPQVLFRLWCQQFIELVRGKRIQDAILLAQGPLRESYSSSTSEIIGQHMSLICYPDPEQSPVAHLMSLSHREETFDELNAAILENSQRRKKSTLEILSRHLHDLAEQLRSSNDFAGATFDLQDFVADRDKFCP